MPSWWAELLTLFHTFGFWFIITAIAFGIIIQYLIRPYIIGISGGFHKVVNYTEKHHNAAKHPTRKDKTGHSDLITRQELINEMGELKGEVLHLQTQIDEKLSIINNLMENLCCTENCPGFKAIKELIIHIEKGDKDNLVKILEINKESLGKIININKDTSDGVDVLHRRLDTFMDTSLATVLAAVEKRVSDRRNGGD
jgi:hypothetical protein